MKQNRFDEEQIIGILREQEGGMTVVDHAIGQQFLELGVLIFKLLQFAGI